MNSLFLIQYAVLLLLLLLLLHGVVVVIVVVLNEVVFAAVDSDNNNDDDDDRIEEGYNTVSNRLDYNIVSLLFVPIEDGFRTVLGLV